MILLYACTDTEYTCDYSEEVFQSIKIGMAKNEVLDVLGKPFYTQKKSRINKNNSIKKRGGTLNLFSNKLSFRMFPNEANNQNPILSPFQGERMLNMSSSIVNVTQEEEWIYSRSPTDTHYFLKIIVFGSDDRVKTTRASLYFD